MTLAPTGILCAVSSAVICRPTGGLPPIALHEFSSRALRESLYLASAARSRLVKLWATFVKPILNYG